MRIEISGLSRRILLATAISLVGCQLAFAGDLEDGQKLYNEKNFHKAKQLFAAELLVHPNNAQAHYLLGNTFVQLGRSQDAVTEYKEAQRLDPKGAAGVYSKQAITSLLTPRPAASQVAALPSSTTRPYDSQVKKSADTVSKQTNESEASVNAEGDAKLREIHRDFDGRVKLLQGEMQEKIAANGQPQYVQRAVGGNAYNTYLQKYYDPEPDNAVIRQEYEYKIQQIRDQEKRKVEETTAYYKQRQAASEQTAVSIDKTYVQSANQRVNLLPNNTSIYTRNYQTSDQSSGGAVPVKAAPSRTLAPSKSKPQSN